MLHVYRAIPTDHLPLLRLLRGARRSFAAFGLEDLPRLLATGDCLVAVAGDALQACLCASINSSAWAYLRGAAIADGLPTDEGLGALLAPMIERLRVRGASHLAAYGTALWLAPALTRAGFHNHEWIVTLERHPRPLAADAPAAVRVRPVAASDLRLLVALDHEVFAPPFRLDSGELVELMVTAGHLVLAEAAGRPFGYACTDVLGDEGQIIRLAVRPDVRRQGIGRTLLNDALAHCHQQGARYVVVNTQESNVASLRLYEQFGFRRVGRRVPLLVRDLAAPSGPD